MRRFLLPLAALAFFSCTDNSGPQAYVLLRNDALLNRDSVSAFLRILPEHQADSSKQVFLKGIDRLKNNNNATEAIVLLRQSIALYPEATAYYELGNAYLQTEAWPLALQSFQMAEAMNYKPLGNVLFKQASCYAEMDSLDKVYAYITYAVQNGFVDKKKILDDVHIARLKNDNMLLTTYNEAMGGNGDPDEVLWHGYSQEFKQVSFPFVVDSGLLKQFGEQPPMISYDYEKFVPEMRDNKFSREVGNEHFYVAKILQTELTHVVLYGCRSYEHAGAPVYYILASFSPKGDLIDKMIVGGAKNYDEHYKVFTAKNKQQFQVEEYKVTYEKSTEEYGFIDNKVVSRNLVGKKQFLIDANGKFVTAQQS